jgi:hypothetical protein
MRAVLVSADHRSCAATFHGTTLTEETAVACNPAARIGEILDHLHDGISVGLLAPAGTRLQDHVAFFAVPNEPQPGYLLFPHLHPVPIAGNLVIVGAREAHGRLNLTDASVNWRTVAAMEHWYCPPQMARGLFERARAWRSTARRELLEREDARYLLCGGMLRGAPGWRAAVDELHQAQERAAVPGALDSPAFRESLNRTRQHLSA